MIEVYKVGNHNWSWEIDIDPPNRVILSPDTLFDDQQQATINALTYWVRLNLPGNPAVKYS
jgi:hypothetical protein